MKTKRIIDSHLHFWDLSRFDYAWLTPKLKLIYRNFLPFDLEPVLRELHIDGAILVQAAPSLDETYFLLELAQQYPFIIGVVGWVDLTSADTPELLSQLSQYPHFRGVRPMLQDIADVDWILQEKIIPSLQKLEELKLTFDALILPNHLTNLNVLAQRHSQLKIVIDHAAKPDIKSNAFEPWANDLKQIATNKNVYCKLSGLLTQAKLNAFTELKPYIDHIFSCFGSKRIMWGSDFPVLNLVSDYQNWFALCQDYVSNLGEEAQANVFGKVAALFYNVP